MLATTTPSGGRPSRVPAPGMEVIGRDEEIAHLIESLATAGRRLVTLVGPGGVGKTTLALETARRFGEEHARPVVFAPLDVVPSADRLPVALVDALELPQPGQSDPRARLLEFLREQELLLVLDNFEHLLDGAALVADMLEAGPEVKLLVTSREALGLRNEWRFEVTGLPVPDKAERREAADYASVQLFARRATQARHDFSLAREETDVVRICRLLEGVPLAIELAASWAASLPCAEIAAEIERGIDFLETGLRDVPDRHRSMRAVFEQSWGCLKKEEQRVFARLSVFRGGFERNAAGQVAGASLPVLASLGDKSLVRADADGRYRLHELLRQCGEEKLAAEPDEVTSVRDAHCWYFVQVLAERAPSMLGGRQMEATQEIARELDNILAAWRWAAERDHVSCFERSAAVLSNFHQYRGRYVEGRDTFRLAAEQLRHGPPSPERSRALALLLVHLGWFHIRLGETSAAREALESCVRIYEEGATPTVPGFATEPRVALGVLALIDGDYARARELGETALRTSEEQDDPGNREVALYVLTSASLAEGKYEEARQHGLRAYETARSLDDQWFMAYCLIELGNVATAVGDHDAAHEYYRASYELRQKFGDPEGMAVALNRLGDLALARDDHRDAADRYRRALGIYREIGDQGGLASALRGLGESSRAGGALRQAARYFREALEVTRGIGHVPLTLSVLAGAGALLLAGGREEAGSATLACVCGHPAADRQTVARAREALGERATRPSSTAGPQELREVAAMTEAELIALEEHAEQTRADELFVEPLTDREREVLERIAAGRSNRQIADELVISIGTVKAHTGNIYGKLGVQSRVQALTRARELGLLPPA